MKNNNTAFIGTKEWQPNKNIAIGVKPSTAWKENVAVGITPLIKLTTKKKK